MPCFKKAWDKEVDEFNLERERERERAFVTTARACIIHVLFQFHTHPLHLSACTWTKSRAFHVGWAMPNQRNIECSILTILYPPPPSNNGNVPFYWVELHPLSLAPILTNFNINIYRSSLALHAFQNVLPITKSSREHCLNITHGWADEQYTYTSMHNSPEWQEVYMYVDQSLEILQEASFFFHHLSEQSTPLLFSLPTLHRVFAADKGWRCQHTSLRFSSSLFCARGSLLPIGWSLIRSLHPPKQKVHFWNYRKSGGG